MHARLSACVCVRGVYYSQGWDINLFMEVPVWRHAADERRDDFEAPKREAPGANWERRIREVIKPLKVTFIIR